MNRLYIIALVVISTIFVGCQTDVTNDNQIGGNNKLTLSISSSRTSLGEKVGDTYPTYWSEDDKVAVNGIASSGMQIDANKPSVATFSFSSNISFPYNITYPYCEATSAEQPIVVLPTEQSYIEGSFSNGSAPMCGYATDGNNIAIKHLASVMRIPVKSAVEGVILEKIVVSSPNKIAGEFSVNCQNAQIVATANSANTITYTTNIALSTTEERVFHIAIPAVDAGACTVELFDSNGDKMVVKWNAGTIQAGVVCEFKPIEYIRGEIYTLPAMDTEEDILEITNYIACGYVKDVNDNPIPNVAVSDGFTVVQTDKNGYYTLSVSKDCWYIFISLPAEYEELYPHNIMIGSNDIATVFKCTGTVASGEYYSLRDGSPAIGAGDVGIDCGVTGGVYKFVPYGLPDHIPVIKSFSMPDTPTDGKINVTIGF